jgi:hypothetical protein
MTTNTTTGLLPQHFAELEPFAEWILDSQALRYAKRLATPMPNMQAFYDAAFPRLAEAVDYCDRFPIGNLPPEVKNLMYLLFSLVEVSFPVEVWRQARVPDSGSAALQLVREPRI